jgi:hypothetical protein
VSGVRTKQICFSYVIERNVETKEGNVVSVVRRQASAIVITVITVVITVTLAFFPLRAIVVATIASSGASMSRIGRFVVPDLPHHVT